MAQILRNRDLSLRLHGYNKHIRFKATASGKREITGPCRPLRFQQPHEDNPLPDQAAKIQPLDRRVRLLDGRRTDHATEMRVSDLRAYPFVVLLGEPGSGKSSVLELEAERAGTSAMTVRTLINEEHYPDAETLFVDALDEYRIDGQDADKVQRLSRAILSVKASRWCLTCRSEDWRKDADLAALQRAAPGEHIVVAKLLSLDRDESAALLAAFGEKDPDQFIDNAESVGAGSLLRSPLSLKLLHKVVKRKNQWPESRYELFDAAATSLAHEDNRDYKFRERTAPCDILTAAENASLLLLVCGARAIWRSNSEPPLSPTSDTRAYLTAHDLQLGHRIVADMLDTGLFTGEGEEFEPLHRSIAEYLAGRALFRFVKGSPSRAAFPLTRALAMITSADGAPPSELRGLFAWFAAHLARQGNSTAAIPLIEADAAAVLFYGDAAAFGTTERRAILQFLDRHDPYFRVVETPDSAIGALAQPDLATEFAQILEGSSEDFESHHLSTIFDALIVGRPIPELRSLLRAIALNPKRKEWDRGRAADAWLNYPDALPRELFDALESEPPTLQRALLRLHLAARFAAELSAVEVQSLLTDFALTQDDNNIGRLTELTDALSSRAVEGFFDVAVDSWLPAFKGRRPHAVELEDALDSIFSANVRSTPHLSASRLCSWINNLTGSLWLSPSEVTRTAINEWLDADARRECELFDVIVTHAETQKGPWQAPNGFITLTGRAPSPTVTRTLLARAALDPASPESQRLRAIVVEIVRCSSDPQLYAETERHVLFETGDVELLERLRSGPAERSAKQDEDTRASREKNIQILTPLVNELRVGHHAHHLHRAASIYFFDRQGMDKADDGNLILLRALTDDATLGPILAGWDYLATQGLMDITPVQLAQADVAGRELTVELAAFAGLHYRFKQGNPPALNSAPITLAFVAMRARVQLRDPQMRKRLMEWALDRLDIQPDIGGRELYAYWSAGFDAGLEQMQPLWQLGEVSAPWAACTQALAELLTARPNMHRSALQSALRAGLVHLPIERLRDLAERGLAMSTDDGPERLIWSFAAFSLNPQKHADRFLAEHRDDAEALFSNALNDRLIEAFRGLRIEPAAAALREAITIQVLFRCIGPQADLDEWYRPAVNIVRSAIQLLSDSATANAGVLLTRLAEDPELRAWRSSLRHARASWATAQRENSFRHPSVTDLQTALQGGPPLSGSDLLAVVWEEMQRLGAELHSSENSPWKLYWNLDRSGTPERPVIENECRSRLLERLRDRLRPYDIVAAFPEAQRRESTRTDMLVLSHAARALPLEVKRHYHRDVWTAISDQLLGYAQTRGSEGFGIYVVFWFGNEVQKPPSRSDGHLPESAEEFAALLKSDLPTELRNCIRVVVLDVSRGSSDPACAGLQNFGLSV